MEKTNQIAVRQAKEPTNQTEINSFIGVCNVCRRFIAEFAKIAASPNRKLEKGEPARFWYGTNGEHEAFTTLTAALLSSPAFALPKEGVPYTVDTYGSDFPVVSCLMQEKENRDVFPVGYWSRARADASIGIRKPFEASQSVRSVLAVAR